MVCSKPEGQLWLCIIGAPGQMNHHLEVSAAIYFLICLKETTLWPLAINIFHPKNAVLMTANLNREQQKLYKTCFLNVSFALYLESQNVLEQLAVWKGLGFFVCLQYNANGPNLKKGWSLTSPKFCAEFCARQSAVGKAFCPWVWGFNPLCLELQLLSPPAAPSDT